MNKQHAKPFHEEDLSLVMKATLGAVVVSLVTSFSTHHMITAAHAPQDHRSLTAEVGNIFEREREVLHAHSNLSRSRYATVGGNVG